MVPSVCMEAKDGTYYIFAWTGPVIYDDPIMGPIPPDNLTVYAFGREIGFHMDSPGARARTFQITGYDSRCEWYEYEEV